MTIIIENGTCVSHTSMEKFMQAVENACCEPSCAASARFVLVENDEAVYTLDAYRYSYANDFFALKHHIECEIEDNGIAVVFEIREGNPTWIWVVD